METGRDSAGEGRDGVEVLLRRPAEVKLMRTFEDITKLCNNIERTC